MVLEFDICQAKLWNKFFFFESLTLTKMDRITFKQSIKIIKTHYKNGDVRWTAIFLTKFSSTMKHISHSVGMSINKIVIFWGSENTQVIEERPLRPEKSLFGALSGTKVWLAKKPPIICVKKWSKLPQIINACKTSRGGQLNNVVLHT